MATVVKKSTRARIKIPQPESVYPGDHIEYSLSVAVRDKNRREVWVRGGATILVREGETTAKATQRLTGYVDGVVAKLVREVVS